MEGVSQNPQRTSDVYWYAGSIVRIAKPRERSLTRENWPFRRGFANDFVRGALIRCINPYVNQNQLGSALNHVTLA
jgi:hypothetical protein